MGLKLPDSAANGIGNAFVCAATAQSDIPGDSFFAQVHDRLGSTAISCRDTDGFGDVMALSSAA
jgi:hypothetical protein